MAKPLHQFAAGRLDAIEALVERVADLRRLGGDPTVEILDVRAHRLGDLAGLLAETLHELAAVDLHGAVELGEVARDQAAECRAVA